MLGREHIRSYSPIRIVQEVRVPQHKQTCETQTPTVATTRTIPRTHAAKRFPCPLAPAPLTGATRDTSGAAISILGVPDWDTGRVWL